MSKAVDDMQSSADRYTTIINRICALFESYRMLRARSVLQRYKAFQEHTVWEERSKDILTLSVQ